MQIRLRIGPVPHCDDDVPLFSLWPLWRDGRQLTRGDPIGPVRIHLQGSLAADLRELGAHAAAGLAGLNAPIPGSDRVGERTEALRNFPSRSVAQLVTSCAAVGVHDISNPLALAPHAFGNPVAVSAGAWEITHGRQLQQ